MFLVDTNVVSELTRARPNRDVIEWFQRQPTIAISVVSVEELIFGVARLPASRRKALTEWLDSVLASAAAMLEVNESIARAAGALRAAREAVGGRVSQADMLIAATAVLHGLPLATRNVRDFEGCGVRVVDPFSP